VNYTLRLASLSLASFFLVLVVVEAIVAAATGWLIRCASRLDARIAARLLFATRIAPAAVALLAVATLCIPSYLWLEPIAAEEVGEFCVAAALLSIVLWTKSGLRAGRAMLESRRYLDAFRAGGREVNVAGRDALVIDANRTTVLAGLIRPCVMISRDVFAALSEDQLEAAVRHETSHAGSHDNWKRLAILLAPDVFPPRRIERAWRKFSEWAADDAAVAGNRPRAVALAEALVRVARIGSAHRPALTTSLLGGDFSARIDRLLGDAPRPEPLRWKTPALACAIIAAILFRPATLEIAHQALEKLTR
jgi:hypothetical protein